MSPYVEIIFEMLVGAQQTKQDVRSIADYHKKRIDEVILAAQRDVLRAINGGNK